jgi:hypothetical protein
VNLIDEGNRLLVAPQDELARAAQTRQSAVTGDEFEWAAGVVRGMLAALETGARPPAEDRGPSLGHALTDRWSYSSVLARDLLAFEQRYRRL